jgi:hypothetical protein
VYILNFTFFDSRLPLLKLYSYFTERIHLNEVGRIKFRAWSSKYPGDSRHLATCRPAVF